MKIDGDWVPQNVRDYKPSWKYGVYYAVDARRAAQVRQLVEGAHRHGLRVLARTELYSWGFEAIIAARPELSGGNPRALCASNPESWPLMQRVIDVLGGTLGVDGFSFQSADQGRCPYAACARWGTWSTTRGATRGPVRT